MSTTSAPFTASVTSVVKLRRSLFAAELLQPGSSMELGVRRTRSIFLDDVAHDDLVPEPLRQAGARDETHRSRAEDSDTRG